MNRYDVTNQRDGRTFSFPGTVFPPSIGYQPEWGLRARTKRKSTCDAFELPRATNERPDPDDQSGFEKLVDLPNDFVVVTTNIDADLADEATKRTQAQTSLQAIRDFDETVVTDPNIRSWMRNVKRVLTYLFRSI
jgi:hypothetical protein